MMNQLKMFFCSVKENFLGDDKKESQWAVTFNQPILEMKSLSSEFQRFSKGSYNVFFSSLFFCGLFLVKIMKQKEC